MKSIQPIIGPLYPRMGPDSHHIYFYTDYKVTYKVRSVIARAVGLSITAAKNLIRDQIEIDVGAL